VEDTKGAPRAFVPLTQQPFVHAIIFPSGGLGLLAVGQRLFDVF
jgi:hypothetical protein